MNTEEEALQGARDIMAEWVSENQEARKNIRELFWKDGIIEAKVVKSKAESEEAQKFKDYFEWSEPIKKTPSHRLLAMRRAENESIISLDIAPSEELAVQSLEHLFCKNGKACCRTGKARCKRQLQKIIETLAGKRSAC